LPSKLRLDSDAFKSHIEDKQPGEEYFTVKKSLSEIAVSFIRKYQAIQESQETITS